MESVCSRSDRSAVELARAGSILFLGYHVALQLGRHGIEVVNVDNLTPLFYDPTLTKRVLHASVPSRGSPRREWIWRTRRAFNCCCQTFSRHTLCTSPLRAGVRYSLLEPQPMCSRTSWRFSMCLRAAGTSVLITSCRLRTRDSARGRSAMVDTFMDGCCSQHKAFMRV